MLVVINRVLAGLVIGINVFLDIRYRRVSTISIVAGCLAGISLCIYQGQLVTIDRLIALLPGLLCLVIVILSKEAIGKGDALLILALGFFFDGWQNICICANAFILAFIAALFCKLLIKKKQVKELPFVPFLAVGYVLLLIQEVVG